MSNYRKVFKKKNVLIPVIHVQDLEQVLRNVNIAVLEGADGVMLISHNTRKVNCNGLIDIFRKVKEEYNIWIGLNFLDLSTFDAIKKVPADVSGLWSDSSGVIEVSGKVSYERAIKNWNKRQERFDWQGLYFGGVAFKYQGAVEDFASVSKASMPYMDVITTSGSATGHAPDLEKIKTMRNAIDDFPLAIASGITPDNVALFIDLADCFLVATGIGKDFFNLDPKKVAKFVEAINK